MRGSRRRVPRVETSGRPRAPRRTDTQAPRRRPGAGRQAGSETGSERVLGAMACWAPSQEGGWRWHAPSEAKRSGPPRSAPTRPSSHPPALPGVHGLTLRPCLLDSLDSLDSRGSLGSLLDSLLQEYEAFREKLQQKLGKGYKFSRDLLLMRKSTDTLANQAGC